MRFVILCMFLLSGCSIYGNRFDCPPGPSVGCEPVSLVNDLVSENALDEYVRGEPLRGEPLRGEARQEFSKDEIEIVKNEKYSESRS